MSIKKIGIDFDNTIISYDEIFHRLALKEKLIDSKVPANKQGIRDAIRAGKGGEIAWQKLQANVYGPLIGQAKLFDGFKDFLIFCRKHNIETFVVSHKSQFAAQNNQDDLHLAAAGFIEQNDLLNEKIYGLAMKAIFFEPTRRQKVERIVHLGCDVFIDDLVETFAEDGFPPEVTKILFNPYEARHDLTGTVSVSGWNAVIKWLKEKI